MSLHIILHCALSDIINQRLKTRNIGIGNATLTVTSFWATFLAFFPRHLSTVSK